MTKIYTELRKAVGPYHAGEWVSDAEIDYHARNDVQDGRTREEFIEDALRARLEAREQAFQESK